MLRLFLFTMFRLFTRFFTKKGDSPQTDNSVKYLIVGLGNIGAEYDNTRHNIGFEVVDYLAGKREVVLESKRYGSVGQFKNKGRTFILLKPSTYMNLSGQAIKYWMQKEKITLENVIVILDDLNLDFGRVRIKGKGGAGGHNGLKNIEAVLQTTNYARVRVGIGDRFKKGRQVDFVLGKWSEEEEEHLSAIIKHAAGAAVSLGMAGLADTMNRYNKNIVE